MFVLFLGCEVFDMFMAPINVFTLGILIPDGEQVEQLPVYVEVDVQPGLGEIAAAALLVNRYDTAPLRMDEAGSVLICPAARR
jgi:hypothetical protein